VYNDVKNYSIFQLSQFCIFILHFAIKVKLVWDEDTLTKKEKREKKVDF
jgi:hypothetical protein